ncbi:hypothetical protein VNO78_13187 [Psophocarpus tetragonolobus]|uniref:Uncharacterized protein n=1 Tax=Psophocarpus tetragonolobus TaxID=3891 RepID=A0AAN9SS10_PSOTE
MCMCNWEARACVVSVCFLDHVTHQTLHYLVPFNSLCVILVREECRTTFSSLFLLLLCLWVCYLYCILSNFLAWVIYIYVIPQYILELV